MGQKSVLIINPNMTTSMTNALVQHAQSRYPSVRFEGVTATFGVPVIASRASYVIGAYAALEAWRQHSEGYDGVVLGCFGDPGLEAIREVSNVPAAGMMEAALFEAVSLDRPYRIVTAGAAWHDMLLERARVLGLDGSLAGIDLLPANGLEAARNPDLTISTIQAIVDKSMDEGSQVVLGGAGFAGMKQYLEHASWVIDGLDAALDSLKAQKVF